MGPASELLRPLGASAPFRTDVDGYFLAPLVTVPDVPVNGMLYAQVRAWEAAAVATYEEARGKGGKFGFSQVVFAKPTNPFAKILVPAFKLQAGLPCHFSGQLAPGAVWPDGSQSFTLQGAAGFRHLIERLSPPKVRFPLLRRAAGQSSGS